MDKISAEIFFFFCSIRYTKTSIYLKVWKKYCPCLIYGISLRMMSVPIALTANKEDGKIRALYYYYYDAITWFSFGVLKQCPFFTNAFIKYLFCENVYLVVFIKFIQLSLFLSHSFSINVWTYGFYGFPNLISVCEQC